MIYYSKSGLFYNLGSEVECSTPQKLCFLSLGDLIVCVNSVKIVLSETDSKSCFVLAYYKSKELIITHQYREVYLYIPQLK